MYGQNWKDDKHHMRGQKRAQGSVTLTVGDQPCTPLGLSLAEK